MQCCGHTFPAPRRNPYYSQILSFYVLSLGEDSRASGFFGPPSKTTRPICGVLSTRFVKRVSLRLESAPPFAFVTGSCTPLRLQPDLPRRPEFCVEALDPHAITQLLTGTTGENPSITVEPCTPQVKLVRKRPPPSWKFFSNPEWRKHLQAAVEQAFTVAHPEKLGDAEHITMVFAFAC